MPGMRPVHRISPHVGVPGAAALPGLRHGGAPRYLVGAPAGWHGCRATARHGNQRAQRERAGAIRWPAPGVMRVLQARRIAPKHIDGGQRGEKLPLGAAVG